jgi:hypothetical protein
MTLSFGGGASSNDVLSSSDSGLFSESQGQLKYYQSHEVWNKGLSWSEEIRD